MKSMRLLLFLFLVLIVFFIPSVNALPRVVASDTIRDENTTTQHIETAAYLPKSSITTPDIQGTCRFEATITEANPTYYVTSAYVSDGTTNSSIETFNYTETKTFNTSCVGTTYTLYGKLDGVYSHPGDSDISSFKMMYDYRFPPNPESDANHTYSNYTTWALPGAPFVNYNITAYIIPRVNKTNPYDINLTGLDFWWHSDDSLSDSSGYGNNLAVVSNTTISYVQSEFNNGTFFNGMTYLQSSNSSVADYNISDPFIVSFWMNHSSNQSTFEFLVTKVITSNYGWQIFLDNGVDKSMGFQVKGLTAATTAYFYNTGKWADGIIHHYLLSYDGSGSYNGMKLYIDGTLQSQNTGLSTGTATGSSENAGYLTVCSRNSTLNYNCTATIDELVIYNAVPENGNMQRLYFQTPSNLTVMTDSETAVVSDYWNNYIDYEGGDSPINMNYGGTANNLLFNVSTSYNQSGVNVADFQKLAHFNVTVDTSSLQGNITDYCSTEHGCNNSAEVATTIFEPITFNVSINGSYSAVKFYRNNFLVQSGISLNYTYLNDLNPDTINISAEFTNGGFTSDRVYWLLNTTEYPYSGTTPTNLSRLERPLINQSQYVYGYDNDFFNVTFGGSNWISNTTDKSIECSGACTGISTYPLEFWVRPIDGVLQIHTKKSATMSAALKIYVNGTQYGSDIDMTDATENYTITISGLNVNNISNIVINSSTDDDFLLYDIMYNRTYPALYDGTNYFQLKKVVYETGTNLSTLSDPHNNIYDMWDESTFNYDIGQVKSLNFNTIQVPLIWGKLVKEIRRQPNGSSNNLYNQSVLQILDYYVDNASQNDMYVSFRFFQWWLPADSQYTRTWVCDHCLINQTERDSIAQAIIFVSNRYKNHTNVDFDFSFENFDGWDGSSWFTSWNSDTENKASYYAYSGYNIDLPHDGTATNDQYLKLWEWQQENFMTLADSILPSIHANNQLMTMSIYPKMQSYSASFTRYSDRIIKNVSDFDYIGNPVYLNKDLNYSQMMGTWYNYSINLKGWGSIPYVSENGVDSDYSYPNVNTTQMMQGFLNHTIVNLGDTDYSNKDVSFGVAGYLYWMWKEGGTCGISETADPCWGLKYKNDTYTPWASVFADGNEVFEISSYSPTSPKLSTILDTVNFTVNLSRTATTVTWYINGTQVQQNVSVTSASYTNLTPVKGNWVVLASATDGIIFSNQSWQWIVDSTPPVSVTNPQTTAGNFFINNSWVNPDDVDFNHTMFMYVNETVIQNVSAGTEFLNLTWSAHYEQNISAQTVDTSGNINETKVWFNATIPNNAPVLTGIGNIEVTEGDTIDFTLSTIDSDGDTITNTSNATEGTFTAATGNYNWVTIVGDTGTYIWNFSVSDGYGGTDIEVITVTVSDAIKYPNSVTSLSCVGYANYSVFCSWQAVQP